MILFIYILNCVFSICCSCLHNHHKSKLRYVLYPTILRQISFLNLFLWLDVNVYVACLNDLNFFRVLHGYNFCVIQYSKLLYFL
jgi:hypothetical protein